MQQIELSNFHKAVLRIFEKYEPGARLYSRTIGDELPQDIVNEPYKRVSPARGIGGDYGKPTITYNYTSDEERRDKYIAIRLGPRLSHMVRMGLLIKHKVYIKRYLWELGPMSDMVKEQGLLDE